MFYIIPTKRGLGVELWGNYDDMRTLYEITGKFWNQENFLYKEGFDSRDKILSGFVYEIRHAYQDQRLNREHSHFGFDEAKHFGCKISWVHMLFSLNAIRFNMRFIENDKLDISVILQMEYWVEQSMHNFDETGAKQLRHYISDSIHQDNPYSYQYMRAINSEYFELGGGKTAFRKLPKLFRRAIYSTEEYKDYNTFLVREALRLNCKISDLELDDEHIDYDKIKW